MIVATRAARESHEYEAPDLTAKNSRTAENSRLLPIRALQPSVLFVACESWDDSVHMMKGFLRIPSNHDKDKMVF